MINRKKSLFIRLTVSILAIAGTLAALGLAGVFDTESTSPPPTVKVPPTMSDPVPPPASGVTPVPTPAPTPGQEDAFGSSPTPVPIPTPTPGQKDTSISSPSPTPTPVPTLNPTPAAEPTQAPQLVAPDPNFQEELRRANLFTRGWMTDFSRHTVPYDEIISGGPPRDGIPPIDNPKFVTPKDADAWLEAQEPVIALEINGDARAYPLQIMIFHEIVNDQVGGVPVSVTFCPLCNAAIAFDRRLDGVVYDFGTSGNLRNSDLVMWDRQTESWWQQFTGEAIVGELAGRKLVFLPASIISWDDFKSANPDGKVLSRDTGHRRSYGRNPYAGYDRVDQSPFLYDGDLDGRLLPKERVATVTIGDVDAAFPFPVLERERVVNYTIGGQDLAVFFKPGTRSALDNGLIERSREVGATGIFDTSIDGRALTFRADGDRFVDNETGSFWNILGEAVEGPLTGKNLTPIVHANHFWFAWGAFKPDTKIYEGKI